MCHGATGEFPPGWTPKGHTALNEGKRAAKRAARDDQSGIGEFFELESLGLKPKITSPDSRPRPSRLPASDAGELEDFGFDLL